MLNTNSVKEGGNSNLRESAEEMHFYTKTLYQLVQNSSVGVGSGAELMRSLRREILREEEINSNNTNNNDKSEYEENRKCEEYIASMKDLYKLVVDSLVSAVHRSAPHELINRSMSDCRIVSDEEEYQFHRDDGYFEIEDYDDLVECENENGSFVGDNRTNLNTTINYKSNASNTNNEVTNKTRKCQNNDKVNSISRQAITKPNDSSKSTSVAAKNSISDRKQINRGSSANNNNEKEEEGNNNINNNNNTKSNNLNSGNRNRTNCNDEEETESDYYRATERGVNRNNNYTTNSSISSNDNVTNTKNTKINNSGSTDHEESTTTSQNAEVRQRRHEELKRKREQDEELLLTERKVIDEKGCQYRTIGPFPVPRLSVRVSTNTFLSRKALQQRAIAKSSSSTSSSESSEEVETSSYSSLETRPKSSELAEDAIESGSTLARELHQKELELEEEEEYEQQKEKYEEEESSEEEEEEEEEEEYEEELELEEKEERHRHHEKEHYNKLSRESEKLNQEELEKEHQDKLSIVGKDRSEREQARETHSATFGKKELRVEEESSEVPEKKREIESMGIDEKRESNNNEETALLTSVEHMHMEPVDEHNTKLQLSIDKEENEVFYHSEEKKDDNNDNANNINNNNNGNSDNDAEAEHRLLEFLSPLSTDSLKKVGESAKAKIRPSCPHDEFVNQIVRTAVRLGCEKACLLMDKKKIIEDMTNHVQTGTLSTTASIDFLNTLPDNLKSSLGQVLNLPRENPNVREMWERMVAMGFLTVLTNLRLRPLKKIANELGVVLPNSNSTEKFCEALVFAAFPREKERSKCNRSKQKFVKFTVPTEGMFVKGDMGYITFRVENVSLLADESNRHYSPEFVYASLKWSLLCMVNKDSLALYLCQMDSVHCKFVISVINQLDEENTISNEGTQSFSAFSQENDWGFNNVVRMTDLLDPEQGFVRNNEDAIIIEVRIVLVEPLQIPLKDRASNNNKGRKNIEPRVNEKAMRELLEDEKTEALLKRLRQEIAKLMKEEDKSRKQLFQESIKWLHNLNERMKRDTKKLIKDIADRERKEDLERQRIEEKIKLAKQETILMQKRLKDLKVEKNILLDEERSIAKEINTAKQATQIKNEELQLLLAKVHQLQLVVEEQQQSFISERSKQSLGKEKLKTYTIYENELGQLTSPLLSPTSSSSSSLSSSSISEPTTSCSFSLLLEDDSENEHNDLNTLMEEKKLKKIEQLCE